MLNFSIIIPVYNAKSTLEMAIKSVIRQTFTEWELIIVDDCSTDGSYEIAQRYSKQDSRITTMRMKYNSGCAKKPRDLGIKLAHNEYCLYVDSDDEIAFDYLQKMSNAIVYNHVDLVVPTMVGKSYDNDSVLSILPYNREWIGKVLSGRQACKLTIPEWQIGCNGMVFMRDLYILAAEQNPDYYMNSDELSERIILLNASKVFISDAEYYYYQHASSITHKKSVKLFETLYVDRQLIDLAFNNYNNDVAKSAFKAMLSHLIVLQKDLYRDKALYCSDERKKIKHILEESYNNLRDIKGIKKSIKEKVLLFNSTLFGIICRVKL